MFVCNHYIFIQKIKGYLHCDIVQHIYQHHYQNLIQEQMDRLGCKDLLCCWALDVYESSIFYNFELLSSNIHNFWQGNPSEACGVYWY